MDTFVIERGFPEALRPAAAALYFRAFSEKLGKVLGHDGRGERLFERLIDPAEAVAALSPDRSRLFGLAGIKTRKASFTSGSLADIAAVYGWPGALWRGPLLAFLDNPAPPDCLHIESLAVAPDLQGHGIGSALLDGVCQQARRLGLHQISLDVVDTNPRARALYERSGFVATRTHRTGPLARVFGFSSATRMTRRLRVA